MRVKCIFDKTPNSEDSIYQDSLRYEFLEIGKEYNVYGMIVNEEVRYYICETRQALFPVSRPASLFKILDNHLSRYWIFGFIEGFKKYPVWIFSEWINEPYFQDSLTDLAEREVQIFKSYKELMDLEFPDSFISEMAQLGDDEWLICTTCIDAWQHSSVKDALVRCPKCRKILNNPRYKNEYPFSSNK